jgi:hypothetical protein
MLWHPLQVMDRKGELIHWVNIVPIPELTWSKAWVCGRLRAGVVGLNLVGGLSVASGVCCQVEFSATGRLPVQRTRCRTWYVRVQSRKRNNPSG